MRADRGSVRSVYTQKVSSPHLLMIIFSYLLLLFECSSISSYYPYIIFFTQMAHIIQYDV